MEHLTLKAVTTATDEGYFEAVISTSTPDREKDVVDPAGMVRALQKYVGVKNIPLAYNHSSSPQDQIGYVDPSSARVDGNEVVVKGMIDLESDVGKQVWRQVKAGTLGFSFGYLTLGSSKIKGGGRTITELDVFEITATPTPMNHETRVLGFKNVEGQPPSAEDLRKRTDELEAAVEAEFVEDEVKALPDAVEPEPEPEPAPEPVIPDAEAQRKRAAEHERAEEEKHLPVIPEPEPEYATLRVTHDEMAGLAEGQLKAVWSAAQVDELPDSAFLYVQSGGSRDSDGKTTPRSLRMFPYKGPDGKVDLPHLRNALARIPQSNLSPSIKDSLTSKAQGILDSQKSVDATGQETKSRSVDPLRALADATALEYVSDGESLRKPPHEKVAPKPEPELGLRELKERARDEMLRALSGVEQL